MDNENRQAPRHVRHATASKAKRHSWLAHFLYLLTVGGSLFLLAGLLMPAFIRVQRQHPDWETYRTLRNLKMADELYSSQHRDHDDDEWLPNYSSNWAIEINNLKLHFFVPSLNGQPIDAWNRPIKAVPRKRDHQPGLDFFSLGDDGISKSNGDDPDDINSWSEGQPWRDHYHGIRNQAELRRVIIAGAIGLVLIAGVSTLRWRLERNNDSPYKRPDPLHRN